MFEQGLTEEEVAAFLDGVNAGCGLPGCACNSDETCNSCYRHGLAAMEPLSTARHVREAVDRG